MMCVCVLSLLLLLLFTPWAEGGCEFANSTTICSPQLAPQGVNSNDPPTWCQFESNLQVVFNLTERPFPDGDCEPPNCSLLPKASGTSYFCNGSSEYSPCYDAVSIMGIELQTNLMPSWWNERWKYGQFSGSKNSTYCVDNPTWCQPFVLTLLGLYNGKMVITAVNYLDLHSVSMNWNTQETIYQQSIFDQGAITNIRVAKSSYTAVAMMLSDQGLVRMMTIDTKNYIGNTTFLLHNISIPEPVQLIEVFTLPESSTFYAVMATFGHLYFIPIGYWNQGATRPAALLPPPSIVWTLNASYPIHDLVALNYFRQHINVTIDSSLATTAAANVDMLMLASSHSVSIYGFASSYTLPTTNITVPFGDKTSASTFYSITEAEIQDVIIMPEFLRRFVGADGTNVSCATVSKGILPSQVLWLVFILNNQNVLFFASMGEFASMTIDQLKIMTAPDLALNPALMAAQTRNCTGSAAVEGMTIECSNRTLVAQPVEGKPLGLALTLRWDSNDLPSVDKLASCANPLAQVQCAQSFPIGSSPFFDCLNSKGCTCDVQNMSPSTQSNVINSIYHVVAVSVSNPLRGQIKLFGAQPNLCADVGLNTATLNSFSFVGDLLDFFFSNNSMHIMATYSRPKWQLDSLTRFYNICATIALSGTNDFLAPFESSCISFPPQLPDHADFAGSVSSCVGGRYCPSLDTAIYTPNPSQPSLQQGYYSLRPLELKKCEKGFFCYQGHRVQCPPGFICPEEAMTRPFQCTLSHTYSETCFHERPLLSPGLVSPESCQDGSVCLVPYQRGYAVAPGYYVTAGARSQIFPCKLGDWCSLGSYNETIVRGVGACNSSDCNLTCPEDYYCSSPGVVEPLECNNTKQQISYCPAGSSANNPCPAGFYCSEVDQVQPCVTYQYCPNGTHIPEPCPGGNFCPHPGIMYTCPSGHFCPAGSTAPRGCSIFTYCPEGSVSQRDNWGMPLGFIFGLILLFVGWKLVIRKRDQMREQREKQRREMEGSLLNTKGSTYSTRSGTAPEDAKSFRIDFQFKDMGLTLKSNNKVVLNGVTGEIRSGRVTAVMGPSGAGKTTFLSTLCGKASYGVTTGQILINGYQVPIQHFRKIVGFVPQEDVMHRKLTIKENLYSSALTRLPANWTTEQIRNQVAYVTKVLGLEEIRHSQIGDEETRGISGGQRKRVNIGLELVADPTVLFLDEPTSGLDSASSKAVCSALRNIAEMGLTIVTVIHQPSFEVFRMFHDVLLLAKGGRTVYLGPSIDALDYFESIGYSCPQHANPADFFMDVIAGEVEPREGGVPLTDLPSHWTDRIRRQGNDGISSPPLVVSPTSPTSTDSTRPLSTSSFSPLIMDDQGRLAMMKTGERITPGFLKQLLVFTGRGLLQFTRNWDAVFADIGMVLLAGGFMGLIYYQQFYIGPLPATAQAACPSLCAPSDDGAPNLCTLPRNDPLGGEAALSLLSLGLAGVAASLRVFGEEQIVYWREASTGTSTLAYFLGKNISHLPILVLSPMVYLMFYILLLTPLAPSAMSYGIFFGVYWTAAGWGYLISIVVPPSQAQLAAVLSVLINTMFSGANPRFSQLKALLGGILMIPTYVSFIRWAQEAFYIGEVAYYSDIFNVQGGLDLYGYSLDRLSLCFGLIFLNGFVVRILAYLALLLLNRDKKQ